jgi:hypothetical protein
LVAGNDSADRIYELENTLREVVSERKKVCIFMFKFYLLSKVNEEVFQLRKEVDEKEDLINKKTSQIEFL